MSKENTKKSIKVFTIALIAPFLVWVVLRVVAVQSPVSFDPNPWIQSMVQAPSSITTTDTKTRWMEIIGKNGDLYLNSKTGMQPLSTFQDTSEKVIFVVTAQGPSFAKKYFDFLTEHKLIDRSLTLSASDGFLRDLRFYNVNLTLGCGQAYVIRWRALKQIGLEQMMAISMSGVWLEPALFASSLERLARNFTDLKVPVFIGPVTTEEAKKIPVQANFLISPQ